MSGKELITAACKEYDLLRNQAAYVLATADWETNHTFKPVREAYWVKNAEQWRKKNLRYYPWYGRGYVQLTWEQNYKLAGEKLKINLTEHPDLALDPVNAADIIVLGMKEGWFTGKKLSDYISLHESDFLNARRIINGTDKAKEISILADKYDAELKAEGYGEAPQKPVSAPKPAPPLVRTVEKKVAPRASTSPW